MRKKLLILSVALMFVISVFSLVGCGKKIPSTENLTISVSTTLPTSENVSVSINSTAGAEFIVQYKIDNNEWSNYTSEFEVDQNCTIYARYKYNNQFSNAISKEITNIHKTGATITNFSVIEKTTNSVTVNADIQSNLSYTIYYAMDENEFVINDESLKLFTNLTQNTLHKIKLKVIDSANNVSEKSIDVKTETVPVFNIKDVTSNLTEQTRNDVILTAQNDTEFTLVYSLNKDSWLEYDEVEKIIIQENTTVYFRLQDSVGQTGQITEYVVNNIDKDAPIIESINQDVVSTNTIKITVLSNETNLKYYFALNNETGKLSNSNEFTFNNLSQDTNYIIGVTVVDAVGNETKENVEIRTLKLPTFDIQNLNLSEENLTNKDVEITVNNTTSYKLEYGFDKNLWYEFENMVPIVVNENKKIYFRFMDSTNQYGQISEIEISNIDKSAPQIEKVEILETSSNSIKINVIALDENEMKYYFSVNGEEKNESLTSIYNFSNLTQDTNYILNIEIQDKAGNKTTCSAEQRTLLIPNFEESGIIISDSIDHKALIELQSNNSTYQIEYSFDNINFKTYIDTITTDYKSDLVVDGNLLEDIVNKIIYVRYRDSTNQTSKTLFEKQVNLTLSYLTIGNSFSSDSMRMIPAVAKQMGYSNLELGYLYYAGAGINDHLSFYNTNASVYDFYKFNPATTAWEKFEKYSLEDAIKLLNWNIIVFQQRSADSGNASTYDKLPELIEIIDNLKTNKNSRYAFNMTWAYQESSVPGSQMQMYNNIVNAVQTSVATLDKIPTIIPVGTVIQNMRSSYIGDTLCENDMKHLTLDAAKIANSAMYIKMLSGIDIDTLVFGSEFYGTPEKYFEIIIESVNNAMKNPFEVTQSSHIIDIEEDLNEDGIDLNKYTQLEISYIPYASWNSASGLPTTTLVSNPDSTTAKTFMASQSFSADVLPLGTRIILQGKITVRFEGWVDSTTKTPTANRPGNISNYNNSRKLVIVDESFISNFTIRAINISSSETLNESLIQELPTRLRIYVPK